MFKAFDVISSQLMAEPATIPDVVDTMNELEKQGWEPLQVLNVGKMYSILAHKKKQVFYVDVGNIHPEKVAGIIEEVKQELSRRKD